MIIDENDYLEHFGKKGMKWGKRSAKQKLAIGAMSAGAYFVASTFVGRKTFSTKLPTIAGAGAAIAGGAFMASALDRKGNTPISKLPK